MNIFFYVLFVLAALAYMASRVGVSPKDTEVSDARNTATKIDEVQPRTPPAPQMASEPSLDLLSYNGTKSLGFITIDGEARNTSNSSISDLMVVVRHYTSDGTFVRSDTAMVEYNPILPGQTSPFKVIGTDNPAIIKFVVNFTRMFGGTVEFRNSDTSSGPRIVRPPSRR
jgi:hypothetical protein